MGKGKILIVDDSRVVRFRLKELLTSYGYTVKCVESGAEALRTIKLELPELIIMDIIMPDMDGYETCRLIHNKKQAVSIPVIFISAQSKPEDIVKAFKCGGVDYLTKPFEELEVLERVHTHLELYRSKNVIFEKDRLLEMQRELIDRHIMFSITDLKGTITHVSSAFCELSGYSKEELVGKNHRILKHPDTKKEIFQTLWESLLQSACWSGDIKNIKKDGTTFWQRQYVEPHYDIHGNKIGYSSVRYDITDKKHLEELAIIDELTQLYNRRHYNDMIKRKLNEAKRNKEILGFVMFDVDHFKKYNDTYGHIEGDYVLKQISNVLKRLLKRGSDYAFRMGGEEFCVLFNPDNTTDALMLTEKIRKAIEDLRIPHVKNDASPFVTVSLGLVVSDVSREIVDSSVIYIQADRALYQAKTSGRNNVQMHPGSEIELF